MEEKQRLFGGLIWRSDVRFFSLFAKQVDYFFWNRRKRERRRERENGKEVPVRAARNGRGE
jgi:hypothetical protein